jgi:hypothetical protein
MLYLCVPVTNSLAPGGSVYHDTGINIVGVQPLIAFTADYPYDHLIPDVS